MHRRLFFLYGITAYLIALVAQTWFICYLTPLACLGKSIDAPQTLSTTQAVLIDIALVLLWGVQHSAMARQGFKQHLTHYLPEAIERSTYVLLSGLVLFAIVLWWQPIDGKVWELHTPWLRTLLWALFLFGWLFSVAASFVINHFELFGLQQVYYHLKQKAMPEIGFQEKLFYRFVRHPIQLGILIGLWATPTMSYGHLLLALLMTLYILVGITLEERDLSALFGESYEVYRRRVGMLLPWRKRA